MTRHVPAYHYQPLMTRQYQPITTSLWWPDNTSLMTRQYQPITTSLWWPDTTSLSLPASDVVVVLDDQTCASLSLPASDDQTIPAYHYQPLMTRQHQPITTSLWWPDNTSLSLPASDDQTIPAYHYQPLMTRHVPAYHCQSLMTRQSTRIKIADTCFSFSDVLSYLNAFMSDSITKLQLLLMKGALRQQTTKTV